MKKDTRGRYLRCCHLPNQPGISAILRADFVILRSSLHVLSLSLARRRLLRPGDG